MRQAGVAVAVAAGVFLAGAGPAQAQSFYSVGHGGLCVDVAGGRMAPGTGIILWNCHGGAPQRFGVDNFKQQIFVAGRRDLCIHSNNLPTGPAQLMLFDCRFVADKWVYDAGRRQVRSSSGLCWDVPGANSKPGNFRAGQKLIAYKCHGQVNQQFVLNAPVAKQAAAPAFPAPNKKKDKSDKFDDAVGTAAAIAVIGAAALAALGDQQQPQQAPPQQQGAYKPWTPPPEPGQVPAYKPWTPPPEPGQAPAKAAAASDPVATVKLVYTREDSAARPFTKRLAAAYKVADDHGNATSIDGPGAFDWSYSTGGGQDGDPNMGKTLRYQLVGQDATRATVKVTFKNFEPHELRYDLVLGGGRWLIDEVYCIVCANGWGGVPVSKAWIDVPKASAVQDSAPTQQALAPPVPAPAPPKAASATDPVATVKLVYTREDSAARPFTKRLAAAYKVATDFDAATSADGPGAFDWSYSTGGGQDGDPNMGETLRYQLVGQDATRATVKVTFKNFDPHELRYDLVLESGRWLIDEVYCIVCQDYAWKGPVSKAWIDLPKASAVQESAPTERAEAPAVPPPPPAPAARAGKGDRADGQSYAVAAGAEVETSAIADREPAVEDEPSRLTIVPKPAAGRLVDP